MPSKTDALAKISAAEVECGEVQDKWNAATQALSGSVSINGYGIFHDRAYALRQKLEAAKASIHEALQILDGIDWPSEGDYDVVE